MDLPADALVESWRSLDQVGNLSSASVLHVLAATLKAAAGERPTGRKPLTRMAF